MKDLQKAKEILKNGNYTCVLCNDESVYTSTLRGVKPLVRWLEEKKNFSSYSAADKVVGRATAFLYLLHGVKAIYADVISKPAIDLLEESGVIVEFSELVENIINRAGDGICPFELATLNVLDKDSAYIAIKEKMYDMGISL